MINNFLAGKKKYSAFLLPILVAIVQAFQLDPDTSNQLMDYLPTIAALLSGVAFIIVEGINDQAKIVGSTTTAQAQAAATAAPPIAGVIKVEKETPSSPQSQDFNVTGHPEESAPAPQPGVVFNEAEFDALVEDKAKRDYLGADDMHRFFAAQDLGNTTRWASLYHQAAFHDYLVNKALKAFEFKFGFPYAEADKHLADDKKCPYYSVNNMAMQKGPDFWFMLLMVRRNIAKAEELGTT